MTNRINEDIWLTEMDTPMFAGPVEPAASVPSSQPGTPQDPMGDNSQMQPNQMTVDQQVDDISEDPPYPDMPESEGEDNFEIWKIKYVKESIKGDPNNLIQKLLSVRNRDLTPYQRKFVEDNLDINFLRQNANVLQVSNEIRKRMYDQK